MVSSHVSHCAVIHSPISNVFLNPTHELIGDTFKMACLQESAAAVAVVSTVRYSVVDDISIEDTESVVEVASVEET